jgi:hypothetical protein
LFIKKYFKLSGNITVIYIDKNKYSGIIARTFKKVLLWTRQQKEK